MTEAISRYVRLLRLRLAMTLKIMKLKNFIQKVLCAALALTIFVMPEAGFSYYIWSPESGKFVSSESQSQDYADELFQQAASYQKQNKVDRAIEEFQNLLRKYPTAPNASEAQYQIGLIFEERKDYDKAVEAYKKVTENYPQSERADAVTERLFKIGNLYMTGEKAKIAGLSIKSGLPKAVDIFEHIVKTAPYNTYGDQAQFNAGLTYKKMGQHQNAIDAFQKIIDQYPNSVLLDDARYQIAESSFEYSKYATRDEKAIDQAIQKISDFLAHYPESSVTDKINALKQEISNRDAEKNYEIGLYYEKEKQLESAALYFEDVALRHPNTPYGKLAVQKVEGLKEPLEKLKREQREMAMEMESVGAKLKSLQSEQEASASDQSQVQMLAEQAEALKRQQKYLFEDQLRVIEDRENAWRKSNREWHSKWKAFQEKRKEMRSNQAPELAEAFQRWEKSLLEEKDNLAKERATIASLRYELRLEDEPKASKRKKVKETKEFKKDRTWRSLVPKFRKQKSGDLEAINQELEKLENKREQLFKQRVGKDREIDRWQSELLNLENQSFDKALNEPWFFDLVKEKSPELAEAQARLGRRQIYLNRRVREFEVKKALHAKQYSIANLERWSLAFSAEEFDAKEFAASGVDIEQSLRDLQQDKARLTSAWTDQKKKVETISRALDIQSNELPASHMPSIAQFADDLQAKSGHKNSKIVSESVRKMEQMPPRILKKRIKFLERQIRERYDEIEDWNKKKDQSISELNRLMQQGKPFPKVTQATNAITAPVRLFLWLARSLTFGLSNVDRRTVKQASRKEKLNDDLSVQIRQLHEQVELESLLIQGRVAEINAFEKELTELKMLAREKDVELTPIYTARDFAIGKESLESASRIIPEEDRYALIIDKLDQETRKLQSFENELKLVDSKIKKISDYKNAVASKQSNLSESSKSERDDFDAETASAPTEAHSPEQIKSEAALDQMKKRIEKLAQRYQADKRLHREALKKFYLEQKTSFHQANQQKKQASNALDRAQSDAVKFSESERELLKALEKLLLKKKELIQSKLAHSKDESTNQEKAILISELEASEIQLVSVRESLAKT